MTLSRPKNTLKTELKVATRRPEWWKTSLCGAVNQYSPFGQMILEHGVDSDQVISSGYCKGNLEDGNTAEAYSAFLKALKAKIKGSAIFSRGPLFGNGESDTWLTWPKGAIMVHVGLNYKINIEMLSMDPTHHLQIADVIGEHILPGNVRKPVYSIARVKNDFEVVEIGLASKELEEDNYTPEVIEGYKFLVTELQRETPTGRLTLIHGEPGTGKSFLLRGLMHEVLDALFVLIPSHMIEGLTGPDLIPALARARALTGLEDPIVLLLEDADKALVKRNNESFAAIASLLNASDGILGLALNLRIVCTTNADLPDIDPALKRPGRMSRSINITNLPPEQCALIYERETEGDKNEFLEPTSLAEVYRFANLARIEEEESDTDDEEEDEDDDDEDWDDDEDDDDEDDDDEDSN
jgi:hypothetical protein